MVKNSKVVSQASDKIRINEIYSEIILLFQSDKGVNIEFLIDFLMEIYDLKSSCKNINDCYIIIVISVIIDQQAKEMDKNLLDVIPECKGLISSILELHAKGKGLSSFSLVFQFVQGLLKKLEPAIISQLNQKQKNIKIYLCVQMLKLIHNTSFDVIMMGLKRITKTTSFHSIFSVLINESVPLLPSRKTRGFTLVLDLDETLGHYIGKVFLPRPGVFEFIRDLSLHYELVLFTSSMEQYAEAAMKILDPDWLIKLRLYRQHVKILDNQVVKDLTVLGRDLEKVIMVDNDPRNCRLQRKNEINIKSWTGSQDDTELFKLKDLLLQLPYIKSNSLEETLKSLRFRV